MSLQHVASAQTASPAEVAILSLQEKVEMADEWYEIAAADHFWFEWRFACLSRLLGEIPLGDEVLEIGCGNAIARDQFEQHYARPVHGCDLSLAALQKARPGRGQLYLYNIHDRRAEWQQHFDTVLMLDVIEHIDDVPAFLQATGWHLRPGGRLLLNMPALQWLYGGYDAHVGHQRRYTKRLLRDQLAAGGFRLERAAYWGLSMIPVLMARKWLHRLRDSRHTVARGFQPTRFSEPVLRALMRAELAVRPAPFVGSSLAALASKVD